MSESPTLQNYINAYVLHFDFDRVKLVSGVVEHTYT